jgi:hypothetical protein
MAGVALTAGMALALAVFGFSFVFLFTDVATRSITDGFWPGSAAAICAAWPFLHKAEVTLYNTYHPVPKEYNMPLKQVVEQIHAIIKGMTYHFGNKWIIEPVDTKKRRIDATLHFTNEHAPFDLVDAFYLLFLPILSVLPIDTRKEKMKRCIKMEVQFKDTGDDTTIVQFDFKPEVQGLRFYAGELEVKELMCQIEATVGAGKDRGKLLDTKLPAPPWWLIVVGGFGVLTLFGSVMDSLGK